MKCGWKGGDCGDVDADAATWRPPTLAEERHDERHLLLPLHRRRTSSQMGCRAHAQLAPRCFHQRLVWGAVARVLMLPAGSSFPLTKERPHLSRWLLPLRPWMPLPEGSLACAVGAPFSSLCHIPHKSSGTTHINHPWQMLCRAVDDAESGTVGRKRLS